MRAITAPPVAAGGMLCVQMFYGATQAYELEKGAELWRASLGGSLNSTPIISEGRLYLATYPGVVYALR
jgi:outer membrane protein assembly factor BamB